MKKTLLVLPMMAALAACDTPGQSALAGAATGAAIGSVVSADNDRLEGALVGGAVGAAAGAAAGTFLGRTQSGNCVYQRRDGSRYTAACP